MKLNVIVVSLLAALLCSCSQQPKEDPKFKPVLNPTPQYFITYKGFIDPSLDQLVKLTILTVYNSTNPVCEVEINKLAGVSIPRDRLQYTYVKPDANGRFSYKVPLDKYLPGFCGWQADNASYATQDNVPRSQYSTLELFSNNTTKAVRLNIENNNWICDFNDCEGLPSNFVANQGKSIPNFENHIMKINYFRRKHHVKHS